MNIVGNISKTPINFLQLSASVFLVLLVMACTPKTPTVSSDQATELLDQEVVIDSPEQSK